MVEAQAGVGTRAGSHGGSGYDSKRRTPEPAADAAEGREHAGDGVTGSDDVQQIQARQASDTQDWTQAAGASSVP